MAMKLFELVGEDVARPFSPFCWRIRMALAHKGLPFESHPVAMSDKSAIAFSGGSDTMLESAAILERWRANQAPYLQASGDLDHPVDPARLGSSDMGNVSLALPTIHPFVAICGPGVPGHTVEFRDAAAKPPADEATLLAATLIAQTAWDLLAEPTLVEAAWREFRAARG